MIQSKMCRIIVHDADVVNQYEILRRVIGMKKVIALIVFAILVSSFSSNLYARTVFDFEDQELNGWEIPDWAVEQQDQVGYELALSDEKTFNKSAYSLELMCNYPGDAWASAAVEYDLNIDFNGYKDISCEIFLPKKARADGFLEARIILVAGPWWWIEQRESTPLKRGKWTKLEAKLDVTAANQRSYWKRKDKNGMLVAHRDQVKKVIIRIEYNANEKHAGPKYNGPIYIDDIKFNK